MTFKIYINEKCGNLKGNSKGVGLFQVPLLSLIFTLPQLTNLMIISEKLKEI
ncbi:unnamed protein product [Meloidogyne enterolobii]|uniref:Uncharacterized protein n=1 Tax=Meloidogyne enterolobii TaxID=390850 RepID=A0ACB0XNZ5_MELEN